MGFLGISGEKVWGELWKTEEAGGDKKASFGEISQILDVVNLEGEIAGIIGFGNLVQEVGVAGRLHDAVIAVERRDEFVQMNVGDGAVDIAAGDFHQFLPGFVD